MNDYKCDRCENGRVSYEEDDRTVTDVCYHCGGSGKVDEETAHHDRLMRVVQGMARIHVAGLRKARNEDPEGEGWAFCAAENMMSERDYTTEQEMHWTDKIAAVVTTFPHVLQVELCDSMEAKWERDRAARVEAQKQAEQDRELEAEGRR